MNGSKIVDVRGSLKRIMQIMNICILGNGVGESSFCVYTLSGYSGGSPSLFDVAVVVRESTWVSKLVMFSVMEGLFTDRFDAEGAMEVW